MPIRKDGRDKRWVEMELLVPGTPEQVWHALATGPGTAAWFVPGEIEPRVGGLFRLDFGPEAASSGVVTRWEPPHHFGYLETDWEPGAPPVATEITITARSGDQCLVRMVHSLFASTDDWDDQMEGFEKGWPGFFQVLRTYLAHFPGAEAGSFMAIQATPGEPLAAWQRLTGRLGLAGANVGERRTTSEGPEPWTGVVEHVHQGQGLYFVVLRVDDPSPGIALVSTSGVHDSPGEMEEKVGHGTGPSVGIARYLYGEGAKADIGALEAAWRQWLAANFGGDGAAGEPDGG